MSSSGSYESEPSRFMENGISFSSLPFWMVIFAIGAEFVWMFFSPGVGCLNISQPDAVFAID